MYSRSIVKKEEGFMVEAEVSEGYVFLHITTHSFNKNILEKLRETLSQIREQAARDGIEVVYFYTPKRLLRLAQLIRKVDYVEELNESHVLGAWETEEVEWV